MRRARAYGARLGTALADMAMALPYVVYEIRLGFRVISMPLARATGWSLGTFWMYWDPDLSKRRARCSRKGHRPRSTRTSDICTRCYTVLIGRP